MATSTKVILDEITFQRTLTRIVYEIIEKNYDLNNLVLIGIKTRGDLIAKRISERLKQLENINIPVGSLDIRTYRDDLTSQSHDPNALEADFSIDKKEVILVDDVLYTGRSIRAAMDAIMISGRPTLISLVTLIDRGHRELPIKPNHVGKNIPTSKSETIMVELKELDKQDRVILIKN
ncbi:MAG: bifunctional pyr operon transcriptional regulator/uracil phosphoribosyltransferase PyrR [Psittacicella sp.]